jgi:DNA-binding PadR family transcriptional regulator
MREPTYFILASLLDGPLHGYALIKRSEELSGGRVRLATGTLYTALDRLAAEGYVRLVSEEIVNGRVRRSYGLTDPGAAALRAEAVRMAEAARIVSDGTAVRSSRRARPGRGPAAESGPVTEGSAITESGAARSGRKARTA